MRRRLTLLLPLCLLSACANPFAEKKPFVSTAVPADFAIVVDENHLTFVNRQHIQQVLTAADGLSRTTYTDYRDPDGAVTQHFTQETPLAAPQLQTMWDEVARAHLVEGGAMGVNWLSGADLYQENTYIIQIRANGRTKSYKRTNGFPASVRPLMLQVEAVRHPPSGAAATTTTATAPATQP